MMHCIESYFVCAKGLHSLWHCAVDHPPVFTSILYFSVEMPVLLSMTAGPRATGHSKKQSARPWSTAADWRPTSELVAVSSPCILVEL